MTSSADVTSSVDYYAVLGLQRYATNQEIRSAYRRQAFKCHPDNHPDKPSVATLFHQLSKALEVLSDRISRAAHNRELDIALAQKKLDDEKQFEIDLEKRERRAAEEKLKLELDRLEGIWRRLSALWQKVVDSVSVTPDKIDHDTSTALRVSWCTVGSNGQEIGGYTPPILSNMFDKFGKLRAVAVSTVRKGSAVVE